MTIAIVGGGLAGATAAVTVRKLGYAGRVVLFAAEQELPYQRPPLSKGYLLGNTAREKLWVRKEQWYSDHGVDLHLGTPVLAIDPAAHTLRTETGETSYERLLLATGSQPRHLRLAEEAGPPALYLRTLADSDRLREALTAGAHVAIVGAGWIGLEVAAAARLQGCQVTVHDVAPVPLAAALGPEVGRVFADLHRAHDVDLRLGTAVTASELATADVIVVGIGAVPLTALATDAGLDVDDGVLVDATLRTSHPDVFAIGDIANQFHPRLGERVRVEHWDTALQQAKVVAQNLLGAAEPYDRLPYFYTDQYDLGMEYVGYPGPRGYDDVAIEGDTTGVFRAYWRREGKVVAAMHANDWGAIDELRAQIGT